MGGDRHTATTTPQHAVDAVSTEFDEAVKSRWQRPAEGFLWRSRRTAEAMLYALLVEAKVDVRALAEQGKGLDALLKHDRLGGAIPREMRNHLESVQKYGNTASHFQPDGALGDASVRIVANALVDLTRWFFTRDGRALPRAMEASLAALHHESHRLRTSAEAELERSQAQVYALEGQLRARQPPPSPTAPERTRSVVPLALGALCLGAALGFAAAVLTRSEPVVAAPTQREEQPAPAPAPTVVVADVPSPAPEQGPSPTVRAPLSCDEGMIRVAAPSGGEFCIDPTPVSQDAYNSCVRRDACEHARVGAGCNAGGGAAANCVTREMAERFCREEHGERGSLPTDHEWTVVGQRRAAVRLASGTREWCVGTDDSRARLLRDRRGGAHFDDRAPEWARDVSFRCVVR